MARRNNAGRGAFNRWDRREVGLRPENALSRVAQLVEVGEIEYANQALYDIITDNQTRRRQWSKTYEGIMLKLMELSVHLKKPAMVKEALHKYRAMCMQSNVSSLEEVVKSLINLAETRTEQARRLVDETVLEGAEDLEEEAMETPETLLLEAAGNTLTRERIDRQQVVPWMRFLWEVYRVVLDIVKTHNKLETCYHAMATKAFSFCMKYKRYMEFRRLCDMLRQHLNQLINNPRNTINDVKITDNETLQKFMETRFTQLSTAVILEHWQEAYRTIEDIHMIMTMGKTKAKPQHMSIFYDKLMQVFWVSGNYLYHAHALYKLYTLSIKQNRNLSATDAKIMASRLLLAALSIPVYDAQSAILSDSYGVMTDVLGTPTNENAARHARMASLLGYSAPAERQTLIAELLTKGVRNACHSELDDLHDLLEGEMAPLQFTNRFQKILDFVNSNDVLKDYATPLRRVAIFRLLEQLSRVYDVMRLDDMKKVASFADYTEVEDTALTALKTRALAVRFDYQNRCLRFESELFSTDGMRSQLGKLAHRMALTSKMLTENALESSSTISDKEVVAISVEKERKALARRKLAITKAKTDAKDEEQKILLRRDIIERRKEEAERRTAEAAKQKKLAAAREIALAEQRRKQEEAKRRLDEQQRQIQAPTEVLLGSRTTPGGIVGAEEEGEAEREERMTREKEKELKEQAEMKKRIQQLATHLNYAERANREEQWSLLKDEHIKESENRSRLTEEIASKELEEAKARHERDISDKVRTIRIMPLLDEYLTSLMKRVDEDFNEWAQNERDRAAAEAIRREQEMEERRRQEEERKEEERRREEIVKAETLAREEEKARQEAAAEAAVAAAAKEEEEEEKRRIASTSTRKYIPGAFSRMKQGPTPTTAATATVTAATTTTTTATSTNTNTSTTSTTTTATTMTQSSSSQTTTRSGTVSGMSTYASRTAERPISRDMGNRGDNQPPTRSGTGSYRPPNMREIRRPGSMDTPSTSSGNSGPAPQRRRFFNSRLQKQQQPST